MLKMKAEIIHVSRKFIRNGESFYAVNDVSFIIHDHEFIAITGKSGSGKSTLLSMIAGIAEPDEGKIVFNGRDITRFNDQEISAYRFHEIGYIPQENTLLSSFTIRENILLPGSLNHSDISEESVNELLQKTGLQDLSEAYPEQLSGGEARRAVIARALINSPSLLIADEPTSSLDPDTADEICRLLKEASENGCSVLMVTHRPENTIYADTVYNMDHGVLISVIKS